MPTLLSDRPLTVRCRAPPRIQPPELTVRRASVDRPLAPRGRLFRARPGLHWSPSEPAPSPPEPARFVSTEVAFGIRWHPNGRLTDGQRKVSGRSGARVTVPLHEHAPTDALAVIEGEQLRVSEIATRAPTLDDVYLHLTGERIAA